MAASWEAVSSWMSAASLTPPAQVADENPQLTGLLHRLDLDLPTEEPSVHTVRFRLTLPSM
jgi:hypothetical protein